MFTEVFNWLPPKTRIEQIAVFYNHPVGRDKNGRRDNYVD